MRFTEIQAEFSRLEDPSDAASPQVGTRAAADGGARAVAEGGSPRQQSVDQAAEGVRGREERFWNEVAGHGTPLIDPCRDDETMREVTFLYRAASPDVRSVRLVVNRVTDKDRADEGMMGHVPGTGMWGVTLTLPADLRCSYGFSPSASETPEPLGTPRQPGPPVFIDPFNADPPLRRASRAESNPSGSSQSGSTADQAAGAAARLAVGTYAGQFVGNSVFSGPLAPDHSAWTAASNARAPGLYVAEREILGAPYPVYVSTPETQQPTGLLVLFDGHEWFDALNVAGALEASELPPLAIIGIGTRSIPERVTTLRGNRDFLRAVAEELVPQIESELSEQGVVLPDRSRRVVSGQSLGGLSSLLMALDSPEAFGTALPHSPSLWWQPGGTATPADLATAEGDDWTTNLFLAAERRDMAFHLAVGSREGLMVDRARRLAEVLDEKGCTTSVSVYQGGHDYACWRGALIDGLRRVFG
ncbi:MULTISPECIES: alpha/beta hydrolase-fold protein [unclassified Brevibacterium]|uniref:alpha/beta hydrolase-fold protein n=1 Tax=unclassified Brevibacterium TaxID=2614124 RepID=UPI001E44D352|nr:MULTISPECIES: alpha/beta hydrolase-fold protein [unclassified Brevibacterium]MDK8433980.1 alpha/beta hydrolase-fold protein [Brevibacterium sp. H-BE7]